MRADAAGDARRIVNGSGRAMERVSGGRAIPRRLTRPSALVLVAAALISGAAAQGPLGVPEIFLEYNRPPGDRIRFCLNMASSLAELDRAIAQAIADVLLMPATFHEIVDVDPPFLFDYRFTVEEPDLFIAFNNNCDVLMGYRLPHTGSVPDWMTITRPYLRTGTVLAVTNPDLGSLGDFPRGATVGSRVGSPGDAQLRTYRRTLPDPGWARVPLASNELLVAWLLEGTIDGALVWEPALYLATDGDPAAAGIRFADLPFAIAEIEFGAALRSDARYLRSLVSDAIEALTADGTINTLLARHGVPGRAPD